MKTITRETVFIAVLVLVVIASGTDLFTDLSYGASNSHIIKETALMLLAAVLIGWLLFAQLSQRAEISRLNRELQQVPTTAAPSEYVLTARKQLNEVISHQFSDWQLSSSEQQVGWLLLKGLSLKEIALVRETLEKTVRQQASAIYKKAGLNGRHAFAAWFIEDLL